jgi:hypothetical protein
MEIEMPINMGHGYRLYITVVDMLPAEFERQKSKLFPIIHSDIDDTFSTHATLSTRVFSSISSKATTENSSRSVKSGRF